MNIPGEVPLCTQPVSRAIHLPGLPCTPTELCGFNKQTREDQLLGATGDQARIFFDNGSLNRLGWNT